MARTSIGRMLQEFKAFAMRGNVVDLAVGIVLGTAFTKIVNMLVANVIMPSLGMLMGKVDFSNLKIVMKPAAVGPEGKLVAEVAIGYGLLINSVVDFIIIAASVFLFVKLLNAAKRKQEAQPAPPPPPTRQEQLLGEIRDLLKVRA